MYKIYDDCISNEVSDKIEQTVKDYDFTWNYSQFSVGGLESSQGTEEVNPQMTHLLYGIAKGKEVQSKHMKLVELLFHQIQKNTDIVLEDKNLIRAKVNLLFPKHEGRLQKFLPHTDFLDKHQVILYYITNSDGETTLFKNDGETIIEKVKPKKGRFIYFDGDMPHSSSNPVKSVNRFVMNLNVSNK